MVRILLALISFYRTFISPFIGNHCRFYPSCSEYAQLSIQRFGVIRGGYLSIARLLKCHPFHSGGVDLVPDRIDTQKDLKNGKL
ncbi:MAG TPA: membrane protein insertion efficiency factor YidD [Crenotrichaceae bacterium]|nr:membrane protein insertion efficiency factor YidD [Crenotrichaceae bacterium]